MSLKKASGVGEDPLAEAQRRRKWRRIAIGAVSAVVLVGGLGGALAGLLPGVPLREGPLDGGGGDLITIRLKEPDVQGVFWGSLELRNSSSSPLTLESVSLSHNPDGVRQRTDPYVWDEHRVDLLHAASIEASRIPLRPEWTIPPRHKLKGYVLKPAPADNEWGHDAEVIFEFAVPSKSSEVGDVTVRYRVGWLAYQKTFPIRLHMCPSNDLAPCK